jgi:hypothetical protein
LGEIEHLQPCGEIANQPFRHHRAKAGIAQRRLEVGIFPFLDPTMRHAVRMHHGGGLGLAIEVQCQRHAGSFTICS